MTTKRTIRRDHGNGPYLHMQDGLRIDVWLERDSPRYGYTVKAQGVTIEGSSLARLVAIQKAHRVADKLRSKRDDE